MLTGCAPSIEAVRPLLPDATEQLNACADRPLHDIPGKKGDKIVKGQTAGVLGDQRSDALAKDKCAKDWRAFYLDTKTKMEHDDGK
jgi:hypothetical protein